MTQENVENISEFSFDTKYSTNRKTKILWILSHTIHQWAWILIALIGATSNAALAGVVPVYIGRAFNEILTPNPSMATIGRFALIVGLSQTLRGFLQFSRNFGFEVIAQNIERYVRQELYVNLLGKSMTFHNLQSVGDLMARATNDVREVNYMFSPGLNLVIGSLNFLFIPLFVAPTYHMALIATPTAFIILYALALWHYLTILNPVTSRVRQTFGAMNSRLAEAIDGVEIVKGSAQEDSEIENFRQNAIDYRDVSVEQGDIESRFLPMLILAITMAVGLMHALLLLKQGQINIGDVIGYFGILSLLGFPTFISLFAYSQISLGLAGAERILELLKTENNLDQNLKGYAEAIEGAVEFKNVEFGYDSSDLVLRDITLKIEPGQTVAIVGQTGSGKTSLVKLINRTFDVQKGAVLVDGVDVRDWYLEELRNQISIIEQDVFLFSRSIAENIAFGKQDATREEVIRASKEAQAHDFITSFGDGYETIIGERGATLSGGQRQRLALARAFLTSPRILVLDDSTSAIDSETEDQIQKAIFRAAEGRTTLIITHRLSQIRWANQIVVMRQGEVVAVGTHEELMEKSKSYQRIFSE
ncbi:MAG: ABC transporter ATP-binding protein [Brevefilum sp.]|nr:ABC transporter ATP-binding protein [Brevefilum sp.]MDT8380787.1 ABC transporter ATP-binding protein [Brevefilum sp.]